MLSIVVSGPRQWNTDWLHIYLRGELFDLIAERGIKRSDPVTLIEGEAQGFDLMAKSIAQGLGWDICEMPIPTWYNGPNGSYNPQAGHERNQAMLDLKPDIAIIGVLACDNSVKKTPCKRKDVHMTHGSADMLRRAITSVESVRLVNPYGLEIQG